MKNVKNLTDVFNSFVSNDEMRPTLTQAFKQDGHYFATDAHALIMMPDKYFLLDFKTQDKPNAFDVLPKVFHEPIEISVKSFLDKINSGIDMVPDKKDCFHCSGWGFEECDLGHEHKCIVCDGSGSTVNEKKIVPNPDTHFYVFDMIFSYRFLSRMLNACILLGIENISKIAGSGNKGAFFKADELNFLIMPIMQYDETLEKAKKISL